MRFVIDLIIINISALLSFLFRQYFGDFVVKQAPAFYWPKYLQVLLLLNITYPILFWLFGLYDKRQKRALLEEFLLIFGIFSTSVAVLIVFLFLGRLWWMSRIVLFLFYGFSVILLCLSRFFSGTVKREAKSLTINLEELKTQLAHKKGRLEAGINEPVSVVIVNFNNKDKLLLCLPSLARADCRQLKEIIVVDNNSSDGTLEYIKKNFPAVKVLSQSENLGYARGVNAGLRQATSEYCLILNPDVIVIPGSLEVMLDYLVRNPKVGLAGCKLLNEDGSLQYSVRRFPDLRTYLYRFTPIRGLMAGSSIEQYYLMQEWDHREDRLVDWVLGGCMLVRKKAVNDVGLMDERFFLYFEDVDFCFRMWEAGWQVAYVAEAAMFHKHMRASANKLFNRATYEHFKSLFYFLRKHGLRLPKNCPSSQE